MTDRYENIRKALEMGPTPGPWEVWDDVIYYDNGNFQVLRHFVTAHEADVVGAYGIEADDRPSANANAAHIAACDPDTIRALLAERDAAVAIVAELCSSREGMTMLAGLVCRKMDQVGEIIDAAIAAANGGGNG